MRQLILISLFTLLTSACLDSGGGSSSSGARAPSLSLGDVFPKSSSIMGGAELTITGLGFGSAPKVWIAGTKCPIEESSDTEIVCTIPVGPGAGVFNILIENSNNQRVTFSGFHYQVPPVILSHSPASVPVNSTSSVLTIEGSHFSALDGLPQVLLGTQVCSNVNLSSSTQLSCLLPPLSAGVYSLTVRNADGQSATLTNALRAAAGPGLTGIVSGNAFGPRSGTPINTIVLSGSGFYTFKGEIPSISVGGIPCSDVNFISPTDLSCTPGGTGAPLGVVDIKVTNPDGQSATLEEAYQYLNPPQLSSVTPLALPVGSGGLIALTGLSFSHLGSGPTVAVGGVACGGLTFISSTSLTCTAPAGTAPGSVALKVTNPDGQSVEKLAMLTYQDPPSVSGVSPVGGPISGGTTINITGDNFSSLDGVPSVLVGAVVCDVQEVEPGLITCVTGNYAPNPAAVEDILVTNADGQDSDNTGNGRFEYRDAPTFVSVNSDFSSFDAQESIEIHGTNFSDHEGDPVVHVGGVECIVSAVTETQIDCQISDELLVGDLQIRVENQSGLFVQTNTTPGPFSSLGVPIVTSIDPVGGSPSGSIVPVEITGSHFSDKGAGPTVTIGGISCTGVTVISPTKIECDLQDPLGAVSGPDDVLVVNPDGVDSGTTGDNLYDFRDDPSFTNIDKTLLPANILNEIIITGNDFSPETPHTGPPEVRVGTALCSITSQVADTDITCNLPALSAGIYDLKVTNPSGQEFVEVGLIEVLAAPTITALNRESTPIPGGAELIITGTNFSNEGIGVSVDVGGDDCPVTIFSPTSLTCTIPGKSGAEVADVIVANPDGVTVTATAKLTYQLAPSISAVDPVGGPIAGGTTINITGVHFSSLDGGPSVSVAGVVCDVEEVEPGLITCVTGDYAPNPAAVEDILVTNADGQDSDNTGDGLFEYRDAPTFASINPAFSAFDAQESIEIHGTNFSNHEGDPVVHVGGVECIVSVVTETQIDCLISGDLPLGDLQIRVENQSGLFVETNSTPGPFMSQGVPVVVSIDPVGGPPDDTQVVVIGGENFADDGGDPIVTVGDRTCTVTSFAPDEITCTVASGGTPGVVNVLVQNVGGLDSDNSGDGKYEFRANPTITGLTPSVVPQNEPVALLIVGTNFSTHEGLPTITVGGEDCLNVAINGGQTELTCDLPGLGPGVHPVSVTNPSGQSVIFPDPGPDPGEFTVLGLPALTNINPAGAPGDISIQVTIEGDFFTGNGGGSKVYFVIDGVDEECTALNVVNQSELTCDIPTGGVGLVDVKIVNPDGQEFIRSDFFNYAPEPTLTNITPVLSPLAGGAQITLTGSGFHSDASVSIVDAGCSGVNVQSSSSIQCSTTTASTAGLKNVTVTNPDGQSATLGNTLRFLNPPSITSIVSNEVSEGGGDSISINGNHFFFPPTVHISGVACDTNFSNPDSTLIQCDVGARAVGYYDVTVTNPDGVSITLENGIRYISDAIFTWDRMSHDFGTVAINTTEAGVELENTGSADTGELSISLAGANPASFLITANTCEGLVLAPTDTCTIDITFLGGVEDSGSYEAEVRVNDTKSTATGILPVEGVVP